MSPVTILPNEGTLLNYVLALIIWLLTRAGTPDQSPQENNFFGNNCSEKVIGDEMHFILGCPKFVSERGRLFYDLDQLYGLRNNGDFLTFNQSSK